MRSQIAFLATFASMILAAVAAAPPGTGYLKDLSPEALYVFPFTATQCEPFSIFYNVTVPVNPFTFSDSDDLFLINIPMGIGYLEWICNIPAGLSIDVDFPLNYVVQPGSSSACLKDVTARHSFLSYATTAFASYTRTASPVSIATFTNVQPITSFPTGAFSTITLNPELATAAPAPPLPQAPPLSTPSPTPAPPAPSSSPTPSPGPQSAAIAGGIVGAVAFVILILVLIYVFWWRRKSSVPARTPSPFDPQPAVVSRFSTSKAGSSQLSSPYQYPVGRPSGAEFYGSTPQYPFTPSDYAMSNSGTIDSPVSGGSTSILSAFPRPVAYQPPPGEVQESLQHVSPFPTFVGQGPYQGSISPFGSEHVLPPQPPREPSFGYQGSLSLSPSVASRASRPADQQTSYSVSSDTLSTADSKRSLLYAMPPFQQPPTSGTQGGSFDLPTVLGVISRAQLNPREREVITSFNNLLLHNPSAPSDSAKQEDTTSSPPPYTE